MNGPVTALQIGLIGSGFIAKFHLQALVSVRHVTVTGVYSPTAANREALAAQANALELGPCRPFASLEAMLISGEVDAVWIAVPNFARLETMREIHRLVKNSWAKLIGVACEKPLGRTLAEAREMLRLAEDAKLFHGYLENQVFSSAVQRGKDIVWRRAVPVCGRPYLARAAEEHSGPHTPWFWQGRRQGGGVLSDMTCHSVEVGRVLVDEAGRTAQRFKTHQRHRHRRQSEMDAAGIRDAAQKHDGARGRLRHAAGRGFRARRASPFATRRGTRSWSKPPIHGPMSAPACES
jgi:predicted dehydrogenase